LDLDDPSAVKRAEPFDGIFPQMELPVAVSSQVHKRYAASLNAARMVLAGYEHNINEVNISSYCDHILFSVELQVYLLHKLFSFFQNYLLV
jgi:hypothetical protein